MRKRTSELSESRLEILNKLGRAAEFKDNETGLHIIRMSVTTELSPSNIISQVAKQLGIAKALGSDDSARLTLWQVIARVLDQGSRLSAVRLASVHDVANSAGILKRFDEDDLYNNLTWLSDNQEKIEDRLFKLRHTEKPELFLYDVTSSYLEGESLLTRGVIQLGLFDNELCEIREGDIRYIMRRNPARAVEMEISRNSRLKSVEATDRSLKLLESDDALKEKICLDGCYVLKTNASAEHADTIDLCR